MSQALNYIVQVVDQIDATSCHASRGVRVAMAFGIVAAAYGLVVAVSSASERMSLASALSAGLP
ncbi:hypothetical protein [Candidatus Burkholderia verschuerenii]|uniref:hypothetical protein n=1 Tax=Candidatus Burkholderia verschuerenii TaxID=242163 RepID=UPI00067BED31|nr:hypothetical protein [Candidatus Burkholderia verschuerenii]